MELSASEYKEKGNQHFQKGEYEAAVRSYTCALELEPQNAVLYSNRALAYFKLNDFEKSLTDSSYALDSLHVSDSKLLAKLEYRRGLAFSQLHPGVTIISKNSTIVDLSVLDVDEIPTSFFKKKCTAPLPIIETQKPQPPSNPSFPKPELPKSPTVGFLTTIHTKSPVEMYHDYVLQLPFSVYQNLYKTSGVDDKFFTFYLKACIWDLSKEEPQYPAVILQSLTSFSQMPRFSLTVMFLPSALVESLNTLLQSKLNNSVKSLWG